MSPKLLLFGAGSLAGEIARSLVAHAQRGATPALRITIAARSLVRAASVASVAGAHAQALGHSVEIRSIRHDWDDVRRTTELIDAEAPDLVLHAASLQSAPMLAAASRWSRFVGACGYGVTTPLQLICARHVQQAIAASRRRPDWVNACYPDLVNACLAIEGPPPLCGIGNVALIAQHVRVQLPAPREAVVQVIAGHAHVAQFQRPRTANEPLPDVRIDGVRLAPERLAGLAPLPDGAALNAFNAAEAARLLWAMLSGQSIRSHAPAPNGLPGGYPIALDGRHIRIDLPPDVTLEEAITRNQAALLVDGAMIEGECVRFAPAVGAALRDAAPRLADGFAVRKAAEAANEMLQLRQRWQGEP